MLYEVIAHVERELAADRMVQLGAEALGIYAVKLGLHGRHLGIQAGDAVFGEVRDRADKIRIYVAQCFRALVIGGSYCVLETFGRIVHEILCKLAAAVRRVYRRQ